MYLSLIDCVGILGLITTEEFPRFNLRKTCKRRSKSVPCGGKAGGCNNNLARGPHRFPWVTSVAGLRENKWCGYIIRIIRLQLSIIARHKAGLLPI